MWAPTRPRLIDPSAPIWQIEECRRCFDGIVEMSYGHRMCRMCWWTVTRGRWRVRR